MEKENYIKLIDFINKHYGIINFVSSGIIADEFVSIRNDGLFPDGITEEEKEIILYVTDKYKVGIDDIFSEKRGNKYISEARQVIAYLFIKRLNYKKNRIARILNRDHHAILHAERVVLNRMETNQFLVDIDCS